MYRKDNAKSDEIQESAIDPKIAKRLLLKQVNEQQKT